MEPCRLDELKRWFDAYTGRFFGPDEYVNMHLRLKQEHTRRTCGEILHLAGRLALEENQTRVAEAVALLHDVGRFPQFATYRTYNDLRSVNHCCLGVEVLRQERVLETLEPGERQWIETAVACHGRKSLPAGLDGPALLFLKLIRDADKLDIYRIVADVYRRHREDPAGFSFEIELPDEPRITPEVLDAILAGRLIEHASLRTLNDMRVCQIGWVYDLNFTASLERLQAGGWLKELFDYLPRNDQTEHVRRKVLEYVESRLTTVS
ncbi:MAG: HD domain-containing protein [Phycisphaerales bacterium]